MDHKKKKKFTKAKFVKSANGAISIFLCLLLTPFLTVALALVEYVRYQEVIAVVDQVYELTGISVLADYDSYIHNRFGLLATTQDTELDEGIDDIFNTNAQLLGNQIQIENTAVAGSLSLAEAEVLRRQVLDFSEMTATAAVILDDFKLQELLDKLENLEAFETVMNTVGDLADTAASLNTLVESAQTLVDTLNGLKQSIQSITNTATSLVRRADSLISGISSDENVAIVLSESASFEERKEAAIAFYEYYKGELESLQTSLEGLKSQVTDIKTQLDDVKATVEEIRENLADVKETASNIGASKEDDEGEDAAEEEEDTEDSSGDDSEEADDSDDNSANENTFTDAAASAEGVIGGVIDELKEAMEQALKNFSEKATENVKDAVDDFVANTLEATGINNLISIYDDLSGFSMDSITSVEVEDLAGILQIVQNISDSAQDGGSVVDALKEELMSVIEVNLSLETLSTCLNDAIESAKNSLKESFEFELSALLDTMVSIVENLFGMDLFFNGDLNALVAFDGPTDSPYADFLYALGDLLEAIESLTSVFGSNDEDEEEDEDAGDNIIKALSDALTAAYNMMEAVFNIVGDKIESIIGLATDNFYEKMIISGYMRHNLPSRTDAGAVGEGGMVSLDGTGLMTGFEFNDIPRPAADGEDGSAYSGSLEKLKGVFKFLKTGNGEDSMFRGAELEYINAGTKSEIVNQTITFFDLYFLRMILDIFSIFTDPEVNTIAGSATIGAPIVYILYILIEPLCDTLLLVNKTSVPLIRADCWLSPTGVPKLMKALADAGLNDDLREELEGRLTKAVGGTVSSDEEEDSDDSEEPDDEKPKEDEKTDSGTEQPEKPNKDATDDSDKTDKPNTGKESDQGDKPDKGSDKTDKPDSDDDPDKPDADDDSDPNGKKGQTLAELTTIDYETHVLIQLMLFVHPDSQINRLGNLIELEAKAKYEAENFEMSKTYTAVEVSADTTFKPFFDLSKLNGGEPFLPSVRMKQMVTY